jgi:hypothetical protein
VVLRLLAKREIKRRTFGRWHEVQAEKEETAAGDGSSVNVDRLSDCRDVDRSGYRGRGCDATTRKMVTFVSAIQYAGQGGEGVGSWLSWTSLV